ncbi:NUDIX domain-containing protein [Thiomicrorhabdus sp. 6S3-12]|uniref:NUDIX domain-containing protein n=1 Tax=Thiomicrorhabdus sp. 6S3-12 TaxID=2819681 RepID=UPI001AACAEF3|nr:NUDIX domain-containing protein [Thiomicrorhabdus sp. 6S3-12]MBO1924801.1 NUDIX domain-containing protein [Thiomicrorhabdus sp. 6S3-12]
MVRSKNTAKGVLIEHDKILLIRKEYSDGRRVYTLPGGTQEPGEALQDTVVREVWEEAGARVRVKGLAKVYEHQRPSKSDPEMLKHKVEFAFVCELTESYTPHNGSHPDPSQVAVEWLTLAELADKTLDPRPLADLLQDISKHAGTLYRSFLD